MKQIVLTGTGGQGLILAGIILAEAAVLARVPKGTEDKNRQALDLGFQMAKEAQTL